MAQHHDLMMDVPPSPTGVRRLADFGIVAVLGWIAALAISNRPEQIASVHLFVLCMGSMGVLAFFPYFGLYGPGNRNLSADLLRTACAWPAVWGTSLALGVLVEPEQSIRHEWAVIWLLGSLTALLGMRLTWHATAGAMRRRAGTARRVVIFGYGELGRDLHERASGMTGGNYELVGVYAGRDTECPPNVERVTSLDRLRELVRRRAVNEIWLTSPLQAGASVQDVMSQLRNELVDLRWIPDVAPDHLSSQRAGSFLGRPIIELNNFPNAGVRGLVKSVFDRVFSLAVLIGLSPLLCVIAIAVKLSSPGPVLFRQARLGIDGRAFLLYKFRSMREHDQGGVILQATRHDTRTTRVGAFLRRTSLDELPQFFNVLKGEMSVVGPRPHALEHNEIYKNIVDCYMMRHRVKPGITGWAQVHGLRGAIETVGKMSKRVEYDLFYIENWTFLMDLRIILKTAIGGWAGKNAY